MVEAVAVAEAVQPQVRGWRVVFLSNVLVCVSGEYPVQAMRCRRMKYSDIV
jgi:hypothetical protein